MIIFSKTEIIFLVIFICKLYSTTFPKKKQNLFAREMFIHYSEMISGSSAFAK